MRHRPGRIDRARPAYRRAARRGLGAIALVALAGCAAPPETQRRTLPPQSTRPLPGALLPDLVVTAAQVPPYVCDNGTLRFTVSATITNNGPATAVLPAEWTKPWVTAYPSIPVPGFVQPYQTGGAVVTLPPGGSTSVQFPVVLGPAPGGVAYDLVVQVDPKDVIQEANESNNLRKISIPATICG